MQTSPALPKDHKDRLFQIAIMIIIAFGVILRTFKYLPAWSLRGDELAVTLNLISRSVIGLITKPLDSEQAAPFGFLLLVKALMTLFGQSEYVLRFVAFAAGCISMILMHNLLSKTGGKYGNLFGTIAFALGNYLIYYSAELKPYSTDVLLCQILLLAFYRHLSGDTAAKDFVVLAAIGILALCFSYPALFIIIGIGVTLLLHYRKDQRKLLWIALTGALWAGTFLALYFLLIRHQMNDSYLITFWDNLLSFMPMPPWRDISWFPKALTGLSLIVAGLSSWLLLVIPIYALGLWGFWRKKRWQWVLALTIPIGLNMVVSGFQKYPFHGRLILYLLPLIFIALGKGIDFLVGLIRQQTLANLAFVILLVSLLHPIVPTINSYLFTRSYLQEDLKSVLSFLEENHEDGDLVYLYHFVGPEYLYYAPAYHLEDLSYVNGQNNSAHAKKYQDELSLLPRGKRIWFIYSFVIQAKVRKGERQNEREYMLNYLKENGAMLNEFYSINNVSSAHLFILK